MIIDITGTALIPGNSGADCPGNGRHTGSGGDLIECCCEECDYMICCYADRLKSPCETCPDENCPHAPHSMRQT